MRVKILAIAIGCLGLIACDGEEHVAEPRVRGLKTFEIADTERVVVRRFPGVLEPSDINTLSFETTGTLLNFDLDVGQSVSAGEVLARLDPTSLELQVESARAGVQQAAALAANAADVLARQEQLLQTGSTPRAEVDNARSEAQSAAASLTQAQRALETAEDNLTKTTLVAPFDGIINSVDASAFQTVSAGTPVASLYDPSAFTVSFSVNFETADRLLVGTRARIRLADGSDITLDAVVSELGARADAVSSFPVVVTLQQTDPLLKAGMAVETAIAFPLPAEEGYAVPLSVIIRDGKADGDPDGDGVSSVGIYVYDAATSTVNRREVSVGGIRENRIIVLDGVEPGDRVASAGVSYLRDGQTVKLLDGDGVLVEVLTRFGIERSRFTVLAMIGVLLIGFVTYGSLPKRENPAITIRTAIVTAQFPGMSPERVEDLLAIPLERAAREIAEVEDISTLITTGTVTLWVAMYDDVSGAKLDTAFQDLRTRIEEEARSLPEGTRGPFVNTNYGDVAVATIAVTGEGFTYPEISDAAEALQQGLYAIDGVTKITLSGEQDERIWLEVDSRRLAAVGVQIPHVLSDLADQNVILPAGEIDADGTSIVLEANGNLETVEEIENVLTRIAGTDNTVRLRDLMTVRRGTVDPPDKPVYFNGEPAVLVSVEMADDRDIQKLGRELRQAIADLEQRQPIGVGFNISTFQEANVTIAINGALSNVAQTFAVVLVVLVLFLGLRPAIVIACIVPFTMMTALLLMNRFGVDLEQVSIAAVIISLGLLVDNGLVVVEDIQTRIDDGVAPREAAISAGGQFFVPLAVASVTTVSAFIPMMILEGATGEFAFSLGAVVAMMLVGSWLAAHYFLPFLSAVLLKPKHVSEEENRLTKAYGGLVRRLLPFGIPVILASYGLVVVGSMVFGSLKAEMFPLSERAEFLIYLDMPKGSAITATRDEALAVDRWLRNESVNPEVRDTTTFVGHGGPRFYLALSPADTDPASAFILVNTTSYEGAIAAADRARAYLFENHPAGRARITRLSMGGGESGIVEVEIKGPDADTLLAAAKTIEAAYSDIPGIILNQNDWGNKAVKIVLDVAQDKAREIGVTSRDISDVLNAYFSGTTYSTFRHGSDSIPIVLRAEAGFRDSLEDLANLTIPTDTGLVSLDQVATFQPQLEFSQFRRENQVRQIVISAKSAVLSAREIETAIRPTLDDLSLGPNYEVRIGGESADSAETNADLLAGMPLVLIVMIAALTFQFNSARRVLLTFMTIPLVVVGIPLALSLTSQPLSFFAILGLISLMGIIINNAIVLIDQIDIERETLDWDAAIIAAAKKRVRPVMLTSLTTVLGLLPMALIGGSLFEPMATLMIGGLLLASPLTLLFVPCGYRLLATKSAS